MTLTNRRNKSGGTKKTKAKSAGTTALESQDAEKAGELMAYLAQDPEARIADIAAALGLPRATVSGLVKRMRTRYIGLQEELYKVHNKDLVSLLDDRLMRMLLYMTDDIIAGASLRDLTFAFDKVLNARQLLKGEPTAIVSVDDRNALNKLVPALMKEAQRRGIIEGEFKTIEVDT